MVLSQEQQKWNLNWTSVTSSVKSAVQSTLVWSNNSSTQSQSDVLMRDATTRQSGSWSTLTAFSWIGKSWECKSPLETSQLDPCLDLLKLSWEEKSSIKQSQVTELSSLETLLSFQTLCNCSRSERRPKLPLSTLAKWKEMTREQWTVSLVSKD